MSKGNILVLTPRFPYPLLGGDKLRIFKMCEALSNEYNLTLVSFVDSEFTKKDLLDLESTGVFNEIHTVYKSKLSSFFTTLFNFFLGKPLQIGYYYSRDFKLKTEELKLSNDIVLSHLVRTANYSNRLDCSTINVLEMTDAISMNYSRVTGFSLKKLIYRIERKRLLEFEKKCASEQSLISLISENDRSYLLENGATFRDSIVVTNGVDLYTNPHVFSPDKNEIIFIGNMYSEQNYDSALWFATYVMPALAKKGLIFRIIGKIPSNREQVLNNMQGTIASGPVDSLHEASSRGFVGVCPMRIGAGVQNKVLEYMALGLPCISSPLGYEGLSANIGEDILLAEESNDYINMILNLRSDKDLSRKVSKNGYNYVLNNHEWEAVMKRFIQKLDNLVGKNQ